MLLSEIQRLRYYLKDKEEKLNVSNIINKELEKKNIQLQEKIIHHKDKVKIFGE